MPSHGFHVPDDSPLNELILERAKAKHDGKVSAYIRALIERDVGSKGESVLPLVALTDRFAPALSVEMMGWIARANSRTEGNFNQTRVVAGLLEALLLVPAEDAASYRFHVEAEPARTKHGNPGLHPAVVSAIAEGESNAHRKMTGEKSGHREG